MKLSILIAAYNVEPFIEKCIISCFNKDLADNYEVIVVNDGSTDSTAEIVTELGTSIPNLRLVNRKNEGLGAARNTGIQEAAGDYLWMIDGDDFIETDQIRLILEEIEQTKLDIYCLNYNITDHQGIVFKAVFPEEKESTVFQATNYYQQFQASSYTWQYIFRKSIFVDNGLLFKAAINMQDSEILPKIIYFSESVKYLSVVAYNYVQHPNSFTNDVNFSKRLRYFQSIIAVNKSLEEFKNQIANTNAKLAEAIQLKQISLHQIVFNHLVFFSYSQESLQKVLVILRENKFYPLQYSPSGKLKLVRYGLNLFPVLTKYVIDKIKLWSTP